MDQYRTKLKEVFNFDDFRDNQLNIIKSIIEDKKDTVAILFTGAGKSLCFQFPPVFTNKTALVVSPLIALMNDQKIKLDNLGITSVCLNSTTLNKLTLKKEILQNKYRLVYTTPEYLDSNQMFIKNLVDNDILVGFFIDEAHAVSTYGADFRPSYKKLSCLREIAPSMPILCLTATATKAVQNDIIKILTLNNPLVIKSSFDRPNLVIRVKEKGINPIIDLINEIDQNDNTIIYCQKRDQCDDLAMMLCNKGIISKSYHAGMTNTERNDVHKDFIDGKIKSVVCTIAFGMGIDMTIRKVINYGMPSDIESYYQQIGRAGRDGVKSECVLYYNLSDMSSNNFHINQIKNIQYRNHMMELTKTVKNYVFSTECRRKFILAYFGEKYTKENCDSCDNCLNKKKIIINNMAKEAKLVFETISLLNNSFGITMIILILRGSNSSKLKQKHKNSIQYGTLKNKTEIWIKRLITVLITEGFIKEYAVSGGNGATLANTKQALEWLIQYRKNPNTELNLQIPDVMTDIVKSKETVAIVKSKETVAVAKPKETVAIVKPKETVAIVKPKETVAIVKPKETVAIIKNKDKLDKIYDLYHNNKKQIKEISTELKLTTQTIENYIVSLYKYDYDIDLKRIPFDDLVYNIIKNKVIELNYPKDLSEIKKGLTVGVSYIQIKIALIRMEKDGLEIN